MSVLAGAGSGLQGQGRAGLPAFVPATWLVLAASPSAPGTATRPGPSFLPPSKRTSQEGHFSSCHNRTWEAIISSVFASGGT